MMTMNLKISRETRPRALGMSDPVAIAVIVLIVVFVVIVFVVVVFVVVVFVVVVFAVGQRDLK